MSATKVFKTPVNKKAFYIVLLAFCALATNLYIFSGSFTWPDLAPIIIISGISGLTPLFIQSNSRFTLKSNHLEVSRILEKNLKIPYSAIYKIKRFDLPKNRLQKWMMGQKIEFSVEVYYNKFDMVQVVVARPEEFEALLKEKIAVNSPSNEASAISKTAV